MEYKHRFRKNTYARGVNVQMEGRNCISVLAITEFDKNFLSECRGGGQCSENPS